ncbi:MAG TPA: hypothetical protein VMZ06_17365 [Candidatus Bathyarchaeia archaeon]|nr:hypothetical protein [Candidatus Bathyarchaeia archaeon]
MEFNEIKLARIIGAVFFDRLAWMEASDKRHETSEEVLRQIRTMHRNKKQIVTYETTVGVNGIRFDRNDDEYGREFSLVAESLQYELMRVPPTEAQDLLTELTETLDGILGIVGREAWNTTGIRFDVVLPVAHISAGSRIAADFLRTYFLATKLGNVDSLFTKPALRQVDVTLKGVYKNHPITFNIYSTPEQHLIFTFDVKTSDQDALSANLHGFILDAYNDFVQSCAPYVAELTEHNVFKEHIDCEFLRQGKK